MKTKKHEFLELSQHTDQYVAPIRSYLNFLIEGDGDKAHCPFTKTIVQKRLFFYAVNDSLLTREEFFQGIEDMKNFFHNAENNYSVVGIVYRHEGNMSAETVAAVEQFRAEARLALIASGLTIAWTHPRNPLGSHTDKAKPDYPLWITEVPVLMLRKLVGGDEPFMLTQEAKKAFVLGMKYNDSISCEPCHHPAEKMAILTAIMEHMRLSAVQSVKILSANTVRVIKKDTTEVELNVR